MTIATRTSIALYCLVGLIVLAGGVNYFLALSPEHQGTYLGLMKGRGAGAVGGPPVFLGVVAIALTLGAAALSLVGRPR